MSRWEAPHFLHHVVSFLLPTVEGVVVKEVNELKSVCWMHDIELTPYRQMDFASFVHFFYSNDQVEWHLLKFLEANVHDEYMLTEHILWYYQHGYDMIDPYHFPSVVPALVRCALQHPTCLPIRDMVHCILSQPRLTAVTQLEENQTLVAAWSRETR